MSLAGVLMPTFALLPSLAGTAEALPGMHRWARRLVPELGIELEIRGTLRPDIGLWVSNHLSWVDPVVLMSLRPMATIAKQEVASYPILGPWARRSGMHFVDRSDPTRRASAMNMFAAALQAGRDMLLFPEGTTTRGERLAPLYEGGLRAAFDLGVPAQPLRLATPAAHYPWTGDESLLPHLRTLLGTQTKVCLTAEEPLFPADFPDHAAWIQAFRFALEPRDFNVC